MGNTGARLFGMQEAPVSTRDSVAGVVAQVRYLSEFIHAFVVLWTDGWIY